MTAIDPTRQVFVLHNQSCADAAADLGLPQPVCALDVNWGDLQGCRLVLWPANTPLSRAAMATNARLALAAGATSVKLVTPGPLEAPGWDAAEALRLGWNKPDIIAWLRASASEMTLAEPAAAPESGAAPPPRAQNRVSTAAEQHAAERPALDGPLEDQWAMLGLEVTKSGPVANEDTVLRCLERHPTLQGLVWYDEFLGRIMTHGNREWSDADDGRLLSALHRELKIDRLKPSHVRGAVLTHAFANLRNCCKDWLMGLKWDGTPRIGSFFPEAFGCQETAYTRAVSRNFWLSMVARVLKPGCKVDNMVILEGGQGVGKSSALKAIASLEQGDGAFFTVQHENVSGKGFFEVLQGKMLVEIAEMDAFGKAEVTRVKQVVSTEVDRYREPWGRYAKDRPRSSIFVGTTNKDDWNRDETGARRFWPIRCVGRVDMAYIQRNRAQCFAEAVLQVLAHKPWWEMPEYDTTAEQEQRREEEPWEEALTEWLDDPFKATTTIRQALWGAMKIEIGDQKRSEINRMTAALRRLGWTKLHTATGNIWCRPEAKS